MAKRTERVDKLAVDQRRRARRIAVIKIAKGRIRMLPDDGAIFTVEALKNIMAIQCVAAADDHKTIGDRDSSQAISGQFRGPFEVRRFRQAIRKPLNTPVSILPTPSRPVCV